jgi:hypothetical protein
MRVAAILGPGASPQDLRAFQEHSTATWLTGVPVKTGDADVVLIFGGDGTAHRSDGPGLARRAGGSGSKP